ncbi:hypothetical protein I7I51_07840 [Histoplasma capsulatum]|uniref:Uncharacterized protein n=1 Tax=Ajellomyces capsulatus TaxID=5037 RepID=A0A8A1M171_AJECA|nr:hypothetical protein I7I51_07840 [Histoplasma capsulatum]
MACLLILLNLPISLPAAPYRIDHDVTPPGRVHFGTSHNLWLGTSSLEGWVWGWDSSGLHQNRSHCFFLEGLKTWKMELESGLWAVDRATSGSRWMVKPERSEVKARGILEAHEILRARGV